MTQFEGHQGKEPSDAMFHPKAAPSAPTGKTGATQGFKKTGKRIKRQPAPPTLD